MNKKVLEAESLYSDISSIENNTKINLRVATFGVVVNVNTNNKTVNVRPSVREKVVNKNGGSTYVNLPDFINVPYFTGMNGSPKIGDFCICIHLDRSIKGYSSNELKNCTAESNGIDKHSLSDCVAIVGFNI